MEITKEFAKCIRNTTFESLSPETVQTAKERMLDTLGALFSGCVDWTLIGPLCDACREMGAGQTPLIGFDGGTYPLGVAAMISSTLAHAVELDDGHKNAGCHAGAVIVPTALTIAHETGASPKELITAIVLGYDITYRLAAAMTPWQLQKGFHPSSICDAVGAMAVAGKLWGFSEEQLANGLGLAASYAAGTMETMYSGQQTKCLMVGRAALNGIHAAVLAKHGMVGPLTVFEGKNGWFSSMSENVSTEAVLEDLGRRFTISDTYVKLYPACRHAHSAIEGVLDLMRENQLRYADIRQVIVDTYAVAVKLTGSNYTPRDPGEAKFSTPYCVAVAMREGNVGLEHLTASYYEDPELLQLAQLVTVREAADIQALFPKIRGARITIETKDDRKLAADVLSLKGSPDKPAAWDDLVRKYMGSARSVLSPGQAERLVGLLLSLDTEQTCNELFSLLFMK